MLVGEEEYLACALERPLKGAASIRGRADESVALTAECLDSGGGVHVSDGDNVGDIKTLQLFPTVFDLADLSHICHGASGVEVGKDDRLVVGEDVSALGHEVDAAKENVFCVGSGGGVLRELIAVPGEIGEPKHLVTLIVVTKKNDVGTKALTCRSDACVHGVVGELEVVL